MIMSHFEGDSSVGLDDVGILSDGRRSKGGKSAAGITGLGVDLCLYWGSFRARVPARGVCEASLASLVHFLRRA